MRSTSFSGYFLGEKLYDNYLTNKVIGTPIFSLFAILMWYNALFLVKEDRMIMIGFALAVTLATLGYASFANKLHRMHAIRYECTGYNIAIDTGDKKHEFSLNRPFFLTKIKIAFSQGRTGVQAVPFYLFSNIPIKKQTVHDLSGIYDMLGLLTEESILLPCEETTDEWLFQTKGITRVSEYPKVMYFPGTRSDT